MSRIDNSGFCLRRGGVISEEVWYFEISKLFEVGVAKWDGSNVGDCGNIG